MTGQDAIALMGVPGSPYTRKMLAVLRYRRIPYRFILGSQRSEHPEKPQPKVKLLPVFYLPASDGKLEAVVDSTPIIRRLERDYNGRSVVPSDPALRFIDELLEDYGDEWLTKAMFHYRWHFKADIETAGDILPLWADNSLSGEAQKRMRRDIIDRQVARLYVVGSNDVTAPVIEGSYRRYLRIMSKHLEGQRFMLGNRPASCDFASFGQLTQLTQVDPTPMEVSRQEGPRVMAWAGIMEDLSGMEPQDSDWTDPSAIPATLRQLLCEVGRTYVPVMLANARALMAGADKVETEVDGRPWVQQPFPYQGRCVQWLRESYGALAPGARKRVDTVLAGTGCEPLFKS